MGKKKVIVAGHICIDIAPIFTGGKVNAVGDLLIPGKIVQMANADIHTGGAVANTGLAMKVLGANVSLKGKLGKDDFGQMVINILESYDAMDGMIISEDATSAYTIALSIPGLDRIFLHHPGANDEFRAEDVPAEELQKAVLLHFGYPTLMAAMYANGGAETVKLMKCAQQQGCATSLDLTVVDEKSEAGKVDWKKALADILPYVDFFVPSIEELCLILDKPRFETWVRKAGGADVTEVLDVEEDIAPLAAQCMALGCKVLMLKCGASGIYYCTADAETLRKISPRVELDIEAWADKKGFEKSFLPERILSTAGAGDNSIAAFLTAMLEGYPPEECVEFAAATGANCVTVYDSLSGLMPLGELRKKIDAGWEKVK